MARYCLSSARRLIGRRKKFRPPPRRAFLLGSLSTRQSGLIFHIRPQLIHIHPKSFVERTAPDSSRAAFLTPPTQIYLISAISHNFGSRSSTW
jgi:hypothetical protein